MAGASSTFRPKIPTEESPAACRQVQPESAESLRINVLAHVGLLSDHVYLNSVQQMVSGELAGEGLETGFSRHGLPPQRAPLDTVYPLREHLNSVQRMVSGG